jgi:membrane protein YdbS with pleckstrin-like domain
MTAIRKEMRVSQRQEEVNRENAFLVLCGWIGVAVIVTPLVVILVVMIIVDGWMPIVLLAGMVAAMVFLKFLEIAVIIARKRWKKWRMNGMEDVEPDPDEVHLFHIC